MTSEPQVLRPHFVAELEQLRLQVEVMMVQVEENLERMRLALLERGDELGLPAAALDTRIDAMNVSLTERCYELIMREAPVAADLRLVVSVVRVLTDLERISDHAVRVCFEAGSTRRVENHSRLYGLIVALVDEVLHRFHLARLAWGSMDLSVAEELAAGSALTDALSSRLIREVLDLEGPDAVAVALSSAAVGRSLERIADHTMVIGARVRYLVTGDPAHLAVETR